jgi:hypothetical protein
MAFYMLAGRLRGCSRKHFADDEISPRHRIEAARELRAITMNDVNIFNDTPMTLRPLKITKISMRESTSEQTTVASARKRLHQAV